MAALPRDPEAGDRRNPLPVGSDPSVPSTAFPDPTEADPVFLIRFRLPFVEREENDGGERAAEIGKVGDFRHARRTHERSAHGGGKLSDFGLEGPRPGLRRGGYASVRRSPGGYNPISRGALPLWTRAGIKSGRIEGFFRPSSAEPSPSLSDAHIPRSRSYFGRGDMPDFNGS